MPKVGSGNSPKYSTTKDVGATAVTGNADTRTNFTRSVYATPCGVQDYQKNKTGLAGNGGDDCLPGTKGK